MIGPTSKALEAAFGGRRVFLTGHSGFKGSWLTLWLSELGADVTGYALPPENDDWMFRAAGVESRCRSFWADVRNLQSLRDALGQARPDFVFHLAAQPLVRRSYEAPLETLEINVLGTANVLEAIRLEGLSCAVVVVTSDKCYENREWSFAYRETDAMGGFDPYSLSKGAAELVVSSYRRSYFPAERRKEHGVSLASARAGNVIGGGDWAEDRLVPDAIRALRSRKPIISRNPDSIRPWQHVLEPLSGYLLLASQLIGERGATFCDSWNFGPRHDSARPVREVLDALVRVWGDGKWEHVPASRELHEAGALRLSIDKAFAQLRWSPRWSLDQAVQHTVEWYRAQCEGASPDALAALSLAQINRYLS